MKKLLVAIAFIFSSMASPAFAAPQDFTIVNNTGHTVLTLNVSPSGEDKWGPDILGTEVLATGASAEVTFDRGIDHCNFDIRVTYDDGDTGDWRNVNLCETTEMELN
jgi:hypothetical protein